METLIITPSVTGLTPGTLPASVEELIRRRQAEIDKLYLMKALAPNTQVIKGGWHQEEIFLSGPKEEIERLNKHQLAFWRNDSGD